ncbi:restriction endonuclease subunit S [Enterococcus sp.]|uniref:restriction endonuclease subunit S n=1 Tax=Enterococcus sp. TaxID=35783 RepID=UPI002FC91F52
MSKKTPEIRFKGFADDWEQRKLGDIAESFEYGLNSAAVNYDGVNKYLRITDIDESNNLFKQDSLTSPDFDIDNSDNYLLKKGDILFARTGASVGKTYKYQESDGKVYYAGFLIRARIKPIFDYDFIFQNTLTSHYFNFIKVTSQRSGQPGVNAKEYANFEISVPNLGEQQVLGNFFTILDNTITLHQAAIQRQQDLKKGLLQQLFPAKDEEIPAVRFTSFTEEWEQRKLRELGETFTGLSGKTKEDFGHGDARFVTYMNVFSNPISNPKMLEIIEIDEKQHKVQYGDVFFTTSSETPEDVGMSSVWLENIDNVYLNSFCFGYRPLVKLNPYYLAFMLRSPLVRKKFMFLSQGISRYNISKNKAMDIAVPMPHTQEQQKIGSFFKSLDDAISLHQKSIDRLKKLKQSLLQKMFI